LSVKELIDELIAEINKNPFRFRLEADVRAWLYNKLCERYPTLHKTNFHGLKTSLVHCEYFGGKGRRIDLVVFDEDDVRNINSNYMDKGRENHQYLYVRLSDAIEIKMELGYRGKRMKETAMNDVIKLGELKQDKQTTNAHFIFIVRWRAKKETKKEKQNEIISLRDCLRNKCGEYGVHFYTNNEKNYFLSNLSSSSV